MAMETKDVKRPVYPGHPVTIAIQIMDAFPNYASAAERTSQGWPAALSNNQVCGAGGPVYQGLEVLRLMVTKDEDPDGAFRHGSKLWRQSREGGDFKDRLEDGQAQAEALKERFVSKADNWIKEVHGPVDALEQGRKVVISRHGFETVQTILVMTDSAIFCTGGWRFTPTPFGWRWDADIEHRNPTILRAAPHLNTE